MNTIKFGLLGFSFVSVSWSWDKVLTHGTVKKLREINVIQHLPGGLNEIGIRPANLLCKFSRYFLKAQNLPICTQFHLFFKDN